MNTNMKTPHKVMTQEEYEAMMIDGWHEVYRNIDGHHNVGVRFMGVSQERQRSEQFGIRIMKEVVSFVKGSGSKEEAVAGIVIALAKLSDKSEADFVKVLRRKK